MRFNITAVMLVWGTPLPQVVSVVGLLLLGRRVAVCVELPQFVVGGGMGMTIISSVPRTDPGEHSAF